MRALYLFIFVLGFGFSNAQIINIPDAAFKNALVNTLCVNSDTDLGGDDDVDTNNDGEIQVSEALAVTYFTLADRELTSVEGIEHFTNVENLRLQLNQLSHIDVSALPVLKWLEISQNPIQTLVLTPSITNLECFACGLTSLDLSGLPNLQDLECSMNQLTALDLSASTSSQLSVFCYQNLLTSIVANPSLIYLNCDDNLLTSLNLSGLNALGVLSCSDNNISNIQWPSNLSSFQSLSLANNELTVLDTSQMTNLRGLNVANNQLNVLDITPLTQLFGLDISGNFYTTVGQLPAQLDSFVCDNTQLVELNLPAITPGAWEPYSVSGNQHLQYINAKNGAMNICMYDWNGDCSVEITDNPNLQFVCIDEVEWFNVQALIDQNNPSLVVSTYCTFTPGGNYNTINGTIQFDSSNNGCTSNANPAANIRLNVYSIFDWGANFSNASGQYTVYTGSQFPIPPTTITPQFENPYYSISPASYVSTPSGFGNIETANFCITPNGTHPDLEISLLSTDAARPGFDAHYKFLYKNKGTETQSGNVTLNFQDAILDFVSANPITDAQSANLLTWNFTNLAPFETREIIFTINVNSPMETPAVNIGDILQFFASVNSQTDETPNDNTAVLLQTVVGSFDPNDKAVAEGEFINASQLGDYLHYTIRFQNTGTFAAENVVVKDMLASNFDWTSLQIIGTSHPYRATLAGNKLEFFFENIQLPPVSQDEPGSHGYVTFKIKPKNTVGVGDNLDNTAEIYFDFNWPIVTNPVTTAVAPLGTTAFEKELFTVYPNPATAILHIKSDAKIDAITIANHLGQDVLKSSDANSIDVSGLASGVYLIKVASAKGNETQKFIKQ